MTDYRQTFGAIPGVSGRLHPAAPHRAPDSRLP